MFDKLRSFLEDLTGKSGKLDLEKELDEKIAAAALLVHAVAVDGVIENAEREKMSALLQSHFSLSKKETDQLIEEARERDFESVDLYGFTSVLNRRLDHDGRRRIVEMLWEIVYADGSVHEFEDNLIWRVAELLGVSTRTRVRLRKQVNAEQENDDI